MRDGFASFDFTTLADAPVILHLLFCPSQDTSVSSVESAAAVVATSSVTPDTTNQQRTGGSKSDASLGRNVGTWKPAIDARDEPDTCTCSTLKASSRTFAGIPSRYTCSVRVYEVEADYMAVSCCV